MSRERRKNKFLSSRKTIFEKVKKTILSLESAPRTHGCLKLTGSENIYRIRVGPYHIVHSIEDRMLTIFIFDVDDRKDVYK